LPDINRQRRKQTTGHFLQIVNFLSVKINTCSVFQIPESYNKKRRAMKKVIGILIALFAGKLALSQTITFPTAPAVIAHVTGYWVWCESCGGIAFSCTTPASIGHTKELEIYPLPGASDSISYIMHENGVVSAMGHARVMADNGMYGPGWVFTGMQGFMTDEFLVAQQDTISLEDYCFDCYSHGYVRSAVGIKETAQQKNNPAIFPNPATDKLFLSNTAQLCEIYDLLGNRMIFVKNTGSIDITTLNKGIYLLCAEDENGRYAQRFVKE
jgi:hypothetical protein